MANTHLFETKFSKRMQASFYNVPVYRQIVNFEERANLYDGQVVTRPRKSIFEAQDYTRGTDVSVQTITEASESLTVDQSPVSPFSIDSLDSIQSKYNLMNEYADDSMKVLNSKMDAYILYIGASGAIDTIDDGDIGGGTAGNPLTLTTSNYINVLSKLTQKLREQNVDITGVMDLPEDVKKKIGIRGKVGSGFIAMSPQFAQVADEYNAQRETSGGDNFGLNGFVRKQMSYDQFITNNSYWSGVLSLATQPTNTDTLVIAGVTVTFVSSIGTTAGNVLIGVDVDTTRASLAGLINAPTTTSATQVAVSSTRSNNYTLSDAEKFGRMTATNDNTADTLTIVAKGLSYVAVSETLTDATDGWTKLVQHNLAGRKGAIDMVIQAEPKVEVSPIPLQLGKYVKPYCLYGGKVFNEGARQLIDVQVNTATF